MKAVCMRLELLVVKQIFPRKEHAYFTLPCQSTIWLAVLKKPGILNIFIVCIHWSASPAEALKNLTKPEKPFLKQEMKRIYDARNVST